MRKTDREYYLANQEKLKEGQRIYSRNNREKIIESRKWISTRFSEGRSAAKNRGQFWNITKEQYTSLIHEGCFYCGKSLENVKGYSLDRIHPDKHYELSNVLPCCGECNFIKGYNLTVDEAQVIISTLIDYRQGVIDGRETSF